MSQGNEKLGFSSPNLIRYLFIYLYFWSERYNRRRGREGKVRGGGIYIRERRKRLGNRSVSGRKETHVWFVLWCWCGIPLLYLSSPAFFIFLRLRVWGNKPTNICPMARIFVVIFSQWELDLANKSGQSGQFRFHRVGLKLIEINLNKTFLHLIT